MSKAILVIDMPESCSKCPLFGGYYADMCCEGMNNRSINYPYLEDFRQDWCPLKQLPNKRNVNNIWTMGGCISDDYSVGWNACINEILDT